MRSPGTSHGITPTCEAGSFIADQYSAGMVLLRSAHIFKVQISPKMTRTLLSSPACLNKCHLSSTTFVRRWTMRHCGDRNWLGTQTTEYGPHVSYPSSPFHRSWIILMAPSRRAVPSMPRMVGQVWAMVGSANLPRTENTSVGAFLLDNAKAFCLTTFPP